MRNVVIIPITTIEHNKTLVNPLEKVSDDCTILDLTYRQAALAASVDTVLVTSHDREIGNYCRDNLITFFPSSDKCWSGTHRCADVASRFKSDANVANVICWPISEPLIRSKDVDELIAKHKPENISTMARSVSNNEQQEFYSNSNLVKLRVINYQQIDFSRLPLPLSLQHIGIYMFSLEKLKYLGHIEPTKLSLIEGLEQLTWMHYGHDYNPGAGRIAIHTISNQWKAHVSIHTQEDLDRVRKLQCEPSK